MSNEPNTYHVLVTLPDVTGEESDLIVAAVDDYLNTSGTAEHLTPETLPGRYIERPGRVWTLTHIADWEGGTSVYATRDELAKQVASDFREACELVGDDPDTATTSFGDGEPVSGDLDAMGAYIQENGWKVHHYTVESHEWPPAS